MHSFLAFLPNNLHIDRGTQTDDLAAIHCFLRNKQGGDLEERGTHSRNKYVCGHHPLRNKLLYWVKKLMANTWDFKDHELFT